VACGAIARTGEIFAPRDETGIDEFRGDAGGTGTVENREIDLFALGEAGGIVGTKRQPSEGRNCHQRDRQQCESSEAPHVSNFFRCLVRT
jgi:hypothetical protein